MFGPTVFHKRVCISLFPVYEVPFPLDNWSRCSKICHRNKFGSFDVTATKHVSHNWCKNNAIKPFAKLNENHEYGKHTKRQRTGSGFGAKKVFLKLTSYLLLLFVAVCSVPKRTYEKWIIRNPISSLKLPLLYASIMATSNCFINKHTFVKCSNCPLLADNTIVRFVVMLIKLPLSRSKNTNPTQTLILSKKKKYTRTILLICKLKTDNKGNFAAPRLLWSMLSAIYKNLHDCSYEISYCPESKCLDDIPPGCLTSMLKSKLRLFFLTEVLLIRMYLWPCLSLLVTAKVTYMFLKNFLPRITVT